MVSSKKSLAMWFAICLIPHILCSCGGTVFSRDLRKSDEEGMSLLSRWNNPLPTLEGLYLQYGSDLLRFRTRLRAYADKYDLHQGGGDVELEIIYLRLRDLRPARVLEFGWGQGMASLYILGALHDNDYGDLTSVDPLLKAFQAKRENEQRKYFQGLTQRWKLVKGSAQHWYDPETHGEFDYIQSDAAHTTTFARWLISVLQSHQRAVMVSFHDTFVVTGNVGRTSDGVSKEGRVMMNFAATEDRVWGSFAVAMSHFNQTLSVLRRIRQNCGFDEDWIATKATAHNNPSLFFRLSSPVERVVLR